MRNYIRIISGQKEILTHRTGNHFTKLIIQEKQKAFCKTKTYSFITFIPLAPPPHFIQSVTKGS